MKKIASIVLLVLIVSSTHAQWTSLMPNKNLSISVGERFGKQKGSTQVVVENKTSESLFANYNNNKGVYINAFYNFIRFVDVGLGYSHSTLSDWNGLKSSVFSGASSDVDLFNANLRVQIPLLSIFPNKALTIFCSAGGNYGNVNNNLYMGFVKITDYYELLRTKMPFSYSGSLIGANFDTGISYEIYRNIGLAASYGMCMLNYSPKGFISDKTFSSSYFGIEVNYTFRAFPHRLLR